MNGLTLAELEAQLMAVRGETRVKTAETGIRDTFLQAAVTEIVQEYDWPFYEQVEVITIDSDGTYAIPTNMSVMNGFSAVGTTMEQKKYKKDDFKIRMNKGKITLTGPTEDSLTLTFYQKEPNLVQNTDLKFYFPQPILVAERAYVRLKASMFPDESNEKELTTSKKAIKDLYVKNAPSCRITNFGAEV